MYNNDKGVSLLKKILLIEADNSFAEKIKEAFEKNVGTVTIVNETKQGVRQVLEDNWDIVIADWSLDGIDGLRICSVVRAINELPLILLSQFTELQNRVKAFEYGVDDILCKPFDMEELIARVQALLRRVNGQLFERSTNKLFCKDVVMDVESQVVRRGDEVLSLTKREYELLLVLLKNKNKIMDRESLLNQVWGYNVAVNPNVVDLYVGYLRNKLNPTRRTTYIQTKHGYGYMMLD